MWTKSDLKTSTICKYIFCTADLLLNLCMFWEAVEAGLWATIFFLFYIFWLLLLWCYQVERVWEGSQTESQIANLKKNQKPSVTWFVIVISVSLWGERISLHYTFFFPPVFLFPRFLSSRVCRDSCSINIGKHAEAELPCCTLYLFAPPSYLSFSCNTIFPAAGVFSFFSAHFLTVRRPG